MNVKTGTLAAPTATGDTPVSTPGVDPQAVIAFLCKATADQTFTAAAMLALGFSDGTTHGSIMSWSRDAFAGNSSQHKLSITALFDVDDPGSTDAFVCTVTLGTGGFTISTSVAAPAGWVIHYMVIGGITSAKVGSFTSAAATGDQDITDPGVQGDFLMLLANNNAAGVSTSGAFGVGVADSAGNQGALAAREAFGSNPTQVYSYQRTNKVYLRVDNAGAVLKEASFVSWLSNGFRLNWTVAAADLIPYLVLVGSAAVVASDTQKTTTGTQAKTGLGPPAGLFVFGRNAAASATVDATQARISLGMTDGSTVGTVWNGETDAVTTSVAKSRSDASKIIVHATEPSTVDAAAALSSLDPDGYTFNYTTADAVARELIVVALPTGFPSTEVLDDFNRSDGALGSAWTSPLVLGQSTPSVASNQVKGVASAFNSAYWNQQFDAAQEVFMRISGSKTVQATLYARVTNPGTSSRNGYLARFDMDVPDITIWRTQNDSSTQLASLTGVQYAQNDVVGLKVFNIGNDVALEAYLNGVRILSYIDTGAVTGFPTVGGDGYIGFAMFADGTTGNRALDDFGGGDGVPSVPPTLTPIFTTPKVGARW